MSIQDIDVSIVNRTSIRYKGVWYSNYLERRQDIDGRLGEMPNRWSGPILCGQQSPTMEELLRMAELPGDQCECNGQYDKAGSRGRKPLDYK